MLVNLVGYQPFIYRLYNIRTTESYIVKYYLNRKKTHHWQNLQVRENEWEDKGPLHSGNKWTMKSKAIARDGSTTKDINQN